MNIARLSISEYIYIYISWVCNLEMEKVGATSLHWYIIIFRAYKNLFLASKLFMCYPYWMGTTN